MSETRGDARSEQVASELTAARIEAVRAFLRNLDPATRRLRYDAERGWIEDLNAKPASRVVRALPGRWDNFVKTRLEPLDAETRAAAVAIVHDFVGPPAGSGAWHECVLREDIIGEMHLPSRKRSWRKPPRWWAELKGYLRRDAEEGTGRSPDRNLQVEPAIDALIRDLSAALASAIQIKSERDRWIGELLGAVTPLDAIPGFKAIYVRL